MSVNKIKIKFAAILSAVIASSLGLYYLNENYSFFVKKDKGKNFIKMIEEDICKQQIFREVEKIKNIKDLNEESKYVYKIIITTQDILTKLGTEKDQSESFYNLFRDLGKVNIFFDIKNKFNFLYQTSYKLPIAKDIEQLLERRVLYKTYSIGNLFFLQIQTLDDQRLKQVLPLIKEHKFTEAYLIYRSIDLNKYKLHPSKDDIAQNRQTTSEPVMQKESQEVEINKSNVQQENQTPEATGFQESMHEVLEKIGQDLFILSSVESMYLEIFNILRNSN